MVIGPSQARQVGPGCRPKDSFSENLLHFIEKKVHHEKAKPECVRLGRGSTVIYVTKIQAAFHGMNSPNASQTLNPLARPSS